jgi:hypothetical protein
MSTIFANPFHYQFWASVHLLCPHNSGLFLSWHRAYIFAFEDALRKVSRDPSVTLPYWDWLTLPELPPIVTVAGTSLHRERYKAGYDPNRDPYAALPTAGDVARVLALPDFKSFGGDGCQGAARHGGVLEAIHDPVHLWVGPQMALPITAAEDPLFWFHHANVDRLWAVWQRDHPECAPCSQTELAGIPNCWKVADVESIASSRLGYEYVHTAFLAGRELRVSTDGFADLELKPLQGGGRVHLMLENITIPSEESKPGHLALYAPGADEPFVRRALFGLMRMPDPPEYEHDIGEHGHDGSEEAEYDDGGHHQHPATTLRIDVTEMLPFWTGEPFTLRMKTTGLSGDVAPRQIDIGQVRVVVTDR